MLDTRFGIEIEMTGVNRSRAVKVASELFGTVANGYDTSARDSRGRVWKFVSDGSINAQKRVNGNVVSAGSEYSVELISPILTYREDIELLQELVRGLRRAGAFTNNSCGIHIHLDNASHTARTVRNFINIIASRNDLFYKALAIETNRMRYCQKLDKYLVDEMNKKQPKTLDEIAKIWYRGRNTPSNKYDNSRYHFLNLHSFFQRGGNKTIEIRGYNSTLHAGVIRSYIVLALALNHQSLTQRCASSKKPQIDNEKFAMRIYLNRIGLIGDEFKACREHLTKNLDGNSAWRLGSRENTPRRIAGAA